MHWAVLFTSFSARRFLQVLVHFMLNLVFWKLICSIKPATIMTIFLDIYVAIICEIHYSASIAWIDPDKEWSSSTDPKKKQRGD